MTYLTHLSPLPRNKKAVFIGDLTSGFLFNQARISLEKCYKAKSWMARYMLHPLAIHTYGNTSECIDYMLTKQNQQLSEFLYSEFNTNESGVEGQT